MEKIASFTIDHRKLDRGIFVSRKDATPAGDILTTFDIRMKLPNREPALRPEVIHTIEHLAATYLRNRDDWKERIIYWGPMGCLTGNYLILAGDYKSTDIVNLMRDMMKFIAEFQGDIPGATDVECGNYKLNDLDGARREAKRFLDEVLTNPTEQNLEYPA
ncbi:MAG: S-ribosylhomocysteine lyase [Muribaculaceae bacterium]|nr:S-ribosylhomocysteine lyase [Muribaculaceae bacterium]